MESWVVGARACLPSARKARSKVGESAPVISVTSTGHRVTAALGVRVVVIERVSRTQPRTGAHDAPPWAIGLRAPLWHSEIGDDEGFLSVAHREAPAVRRAPCGGGAALEPLFSLIVRRATARTPHGQGRGARAGETSKGV